MGLVARGEITPSERPRHYLERIERCIDALGAFVTVNAVAALERAVYVEANVPRVASLLGLPIAD